MIIKKNPEVSLEKRKGSYFAVGLLFALAAVFSMFEYRSYDTQVVKDLGQVEINMLEEEVIPVTQETPPPPPPPQQQNITQLQIVSDEETIEEELDIKDMEVEVDTKVDYEVPETVIEEPEEEPVEEEEIFTIVEQMPEFPGGIEALFKYLADNLKYPAMARDAKIQGKVYVTFVVDKDGSISDVKVLRGIGGGCDEEAVRVIKNMPKWKPGRQRDIPVRVQYNLPINFILK